MGLVTLWGCGVRQLARGELNPPEVTLKAVTLSPPNSAGWPLSLSLLLKNPNPQSLSLLGYDFDFGLEGRSVAQGASQEAVTLPPQGQAVVEVPILLKLPALMKVWPALLLYEKQKLRYQVSGGFRLASLLGGLRVPFKFQGELTPREGLDHLRPYLK
ncbi:MAG: LEA type 2 family protein [Desulfobaccales bacterium]|nr:LEA type 2 family protein [Desulfobaccales bacterium]